MLSSGKQLSAHIAPGMQLENVPLQLHCFPYNLVAQRLN